MTRDREVVGRPVLKVFLALASVGAMSACLLSLHVAEGAEAADGQQGIATIKLPPGYRDWTLISVAHEAGKLNDLRAVLGNREAIMSYRGGTLPYPDGTIIARLAWTYTPSEDNNRAFGQQQSFVAGAPTNVQLMVKDSKKYASTGGWGFAQFDGREPVSRALETCFSCHAPVRDRDYVFTRYAP